MYGANPKDKHPLAEFPQICFIKNTVNNPNIIIGDYTYYDDPEDSENFERNVLYHYSFSKDKLIIGKFCALARGIKFIMNGANHQISGFSTYPFYIFGKGWEKATPQDNELPFKGDIIVGNDVWLGYESTIMPGVTIGDGAIIAAKSVVACNAKTQAQSQNVTPETKTQVKRPKQVVALGKLIPKGEVIKLSVANAEDSRVNQILVEEGDRVEKNQVIAILQGFENRERDLEEAEKAVELAQARNERKARLNNTLQTLKQEITQERENLARLEEIRPVDVRVAEIELERAVIAVEQRRADLEDTKVKVPIAGQILRINTRVGEQVNTQRGIVELGQTDKMYAIAEVYETDISKASPTIFEGAQVEDFTDLMALWMRP